ncbi:hypothetical protein [Pseudohongiella nitratireducens]|uniref:hypothetical protein n=1 Tax=Pseudohongiella nitratireducens TaxID=1768907 RepID=UPI0030ED7884|tara:strand:+ start:2460 stop:2657 length:198 start_codon:yes stop_codon:yes gene_type:complete
MSDTCKRCNDLPARNNSRWCGECHYPGIDDDYQLFKDMLSDGYRYIDAAVQSGWRGAEEFMETDQ